MNKLNWKPGEPKPDLLASRLAELRIQLKKRKPERLANNSGTKYNKIDQIGGEFHLQHWDRDVVLTFPDLFTYNSQSGEKLSSSSQALVLYYFTICDGTLPSGEWISFSELPDGRFYNQAYQGYTGGKLAQVFQNDFDMFCKVADKLGGKRVYLLGDAAYEFQALPLVNLLVVTWQGDEEFHSTYQILFDAAVSHHLPTDACAILGSSLTHRLTVETESLDENRH